MIPKSFSATAINTFELCPSRYRAEAIERSKSFGGFGSAATLGSTVHGGLEEYVKIVHLNHAEAPSEKLLLDLFKLSYMKEFNSADTDTPEYQDGLKMCSDWFARTKWEGVEVLSVEVKSNFPIPVMIDGAEAEIPFNYIWDRFDRIGENKFRVVDYKTNRWGINPADLVKKVQARCYGLAAAIQLGKEGLPNDRIMVEFDMLRHQPVGVVFTRADNAATWRYLKESTQTIIDTPDEEVPERLNGECLFCVRKADCGALKKNLQVGGIHTIGNIEEAIDLRAQLDWQLRGINSLIKDLDEKILTEAKARDIEEYESDVNKLVIGVSRRRAVDAEMVRMAVGERTFEKYGAMNLTMGNLDKMLKDPNVTSEQKAQVRGLIYYTTGNPSVKVETKNVIDD